MLGSAAEAEDIVQDVWVRWQTADRSVVRDAAGVPRDDDDTTGDQRHAVSTLAPGNVRRALAAGTSGHERRPWVGSGTRRGAGVRGPGIAEKAVAHGTSRVHPSGSVRLHIPRHRERPSARRGQRAASGDSRAAARREWPTRAREFDRAKTFRPQAFIAPPSMATSPASKVSWRQTSFPSPPAQSPRDPHQFEANGIYEGRFGTIVLKRRPKKRHSRANSDDCPSNAAQAPEALHRRKRLSAAERSICLNDKIRSHQNRWSRRSHLRLPCFWAGAGRAAEGEAIALLWSLGFLAAGFVVGFLFGVTRVLNDALNSRQTESAPKPSSRWQ